MKIAFIDLDGTVVVPGTHDLLPGALAQLEKLVADGWLIVWFTCWAMTERDKDWLENLSQNLRVPYAVLRKPLADEYAVLDDKLTLSGQSLWAGEAA